MAVLSQDRIATLVAPYLTHCEPLLPKLEVYLDLLVRWNAKTNLTAVRDPEEMVRRHFGESLFAAQHLGNTLPATLLDLGSGAGFPGIPIALAHPNVAVTLAESQGKKASFLREAVRTLGLNNVEVWASRAETLPKAFHTVTLRAVDDMAVALSAANALALEQIVLLTTRTPDLPQGFTLAESVPLPGLESGVVLRATR